MSYLCHRLVSGPALQATSDSKHRRSPYVYDRHNVFSSQKATANRTSQTTHQHHLLVLTDNDAITREALNSKNIIDSISLILPLGYGWVTPINQLKKCHRTQSNSCAC